MLVVFGKAIKGAIKQGSRSWKILYCQDGRAFKREIIMAYSRFPETP